MKTPLSLLSLLLALTFPALAFADPPSLVGRLNLAEGSVSLRSGGQGDWAPVLLNYPLGAGDDLWADYGARAEIHAGSTALRLDESTVISFSNLDDGALQFAVSQGRVNVRLRRLDPGETFVIDTPEATVSLLEPGSYVVSVQQGLQSRVIVWSGRAEVDAGGGGFRVTAGQSAILSGDGTGHYDLQGAPARGDWDSWYESRDAREDRLAAESYVPREMIGVEDLDEYGSWTVLPDYGPAWCPRSVESDWAPYRYGRWTWVRPWGWTWIDDARWGFAPFHYGRWLSRDSRWFWLPGDAHARPVYAPALVVFIGGGSADPDAEGIGWFPLGPREVYIPPYEASAAYVQRINITNVVNINVQMIRDIDVKRITYVNRFVPRAVTSVRRQSFPVDRPAIGMVAPFSQDQIRRAPVMGMGAPIAPPREGGSFPRPLPQAPRQPQRQLQIQPRPYPQAQIYPQPRPLVQPQPQYQGRPYPQPRPLVQPRPQVQPQPFPQRPQAQPQVQPRPSPQPQVQGRPQPGRSDAEARGLIDSLKSNTLPGVKGHLESARTRAGGRLDYPGFSKRLDSARSDIAAAESALSAGRGDAALQQAREVQRKLLEADQGISGAEGGGGNAPDKRR